MDDGCVYRRARRGEELMSKYVIEYKGRKSIVKFDSDLPFEMIHDLGTLGPITVWENGVQIFDSKPKAKNVKTSNSKKANASGKKSSPKTKAPA